MANIKELETEIRAAVAAAQTKMQEVETEIRAAVAAAQTKMQEVETEIRAAVAAAQARGLVLTRGITNDGERCCLLGAFAEGPADVVDTLNMLEARWGLDEEDLRDLMGGFDGLYMYATDWALLGKRLADELGAAPEPPERMPSWGEGVSDE